MQNNKMHNNKIQYNNTQQNNNLINKIKCYSLNKQNMDFITKNIITKNNILNNKNNKYVENKIINKDKIYIPKQLDTFFWCLYIMINGIQQYNTIQNKCFAKEKELKFNYVDLIRKNRIILKNKKIKKIDDIENELITNNKIDINIFIALIILEGINVIIINKKIYYELVNNDDNDFFVIHIIHNKCGYEENVSKEKIQEYKNTLLKVDNINKPIKAISNYKLDEIREISKIFGLNIMNNNDKKKTKSELYEEIITSM
jgi:hypothetical protein